VELHALSLFSVLIAGCTALAGLDGDYQLGEQTASASGGAVSSASVSSTVSSSSSSSSSSGAGGTASSAGSGGEFSCPANYKMETNGGCYRMGQEVDDWLSSELDCESDGGHLVVIDDAIEDQLVPDSVWIGYTERVQSGDFRWVNGSTDAFDTWASGQPVSGGGLCTEARSDGWHDDICSEDKSYLCEYDGLAADPTTY
jgi:hypothetical protein